MALIEKLALIQYEKTFTPEGIVEHVKYAHVIERDGKQIQAIPHRIVIDPTIPDMNHQMPDGTVKTTAEILAEIGA